MSKKILLILALIFVIVLPVFGQTGAYTTNEYFYLPEYGAYGTDEYDEYNAYMEIADLQIKANKDAITAKQPLDAGLTSIAALTTAANKSIYTTALDTYSVYTLTAFARTILDDANASTVRSTIGVDLSLYYLKTEINTLAKWETIWSKDVLDTTELNTFAKLQALVADKTLVNEEDVFTIDANWVNTANPWADNEVADNITIDLATLATTFTVTDNESEALNCLVLFVDGATGAQGAETDGDLHYNPSTGTLTATEFVGGGTGLTGLQTTLTNEAGLYSALSDVSLFLEDTVDDTSPELGGELDAGAHSIGFTQQAVTGSDTTTTINWTLGNKFFFTFGAMNETLTFTDPSNPCNLLLVVKQDGTGSRTMTFPTILWAGGTAPTLTTAGNSIDIVSFYFDGTNYYGVASLAFATP